MTRVSPGVYRNAQGGLVQSQNGRMPQPNQPKPQPQAAPQPAPQPQFANAQNRLNNLQAKLVASGQTPTAQQQKTMDELTRRAGIAANNAANQGGANQGTANQGAQVDPTIPGLSEGAQEVAAAGTQYALDQLNDGTFANPFQAQLADRVGQEDLEGFRSNIYDQQYGYLTRDLGQQEAQAGQDISQSLADRGIPYSADPMSRYQQEMRDYNNRFDRARADARAQAGQFAGQEMQRYFGINEQTRANQLSEQLQGRNQQLNEINMLPQLGMQPISTYESLQDVDAARKQQKQLAIKALNKPSGGGSGGWSPPANPNPFEGL